jgi:hypothetical protein
MAGAKNAGTMKRENITKQEAREKFRPIVNDPWILDYP